MGPNERGSVTTGFKNVLFLCKGNYYRSRYAEEVFNYVARLEDLSWRAFSRGAAKKGSPENKGPISPFAQGKRHLIDGATRDPLPCTFTDFEAAQLVIGLRKQNTEHLLSSASPAYAMSAEYWDVDDIRVRQSIERARQDRRFDRQVDLKAARGERLRLLPNFPRV